MKILPACFSVLASLAFFVPAPGTAQEPAAEAEPATHCRFVPERSDDFAWENNLVAFRVYGPALRKGAENSGIDCWAKRVEYPIVDKWYRMDAEEGKSYHQDRGEGCDFYHVGKSRGCGGTAIWHDGRMLLSNVYTEWEVVESTQKRSIFRLSYEYDLEGRKIQELKTITIVLDQRLFRSESVFTEDGKPVDLEIAIGLSTQNQQGHAVFEPKKGWMSVWEKGHGGFGTGVVMDPANLVRMEEVKSNTRDASHAVAIARTDKDGRTVHYTGFAWAKACEIRKEEQWTEFLTSFAEKLARW